MTVSVLAYAAVSAQGAGADAIDPGPVGAPSPCHVREDDTLRLAGVRRPYVARAALVDPDDRDDRAGRMLAHVLRDLKPQLQRLALLPDAGRTRIYMGTSSGGMQSSVRCVHALDQGGPVDPSLANAATYFGPLSELAADPLLAGVPVFQVLSACASSTIALGLGLRALQLGDADLVIAGGYDAVTPFVAAGFDALGATSSRPRPYREDRDGLALGEGAALLVLARGADTDLGTLAGFAASSDAFHVTQPHPDGTGLSAAAIRALMDAGLSEVDFVSGHGTATHLNDVREAKGMVVACPNRPVVHGFKGAIGHTLGAAGALESLSALSAMRSELYPASTGPGNVIAQLAGQVLDESRGGEPRACLKLSAAFGGANAALVWTRGGAPARPVRAARGVVLVGPPVHVTTTELAPHPMLVADLASLQRSDPISRLAIMAALSACSANGQALPRDTAVILGTAAATLEINAAFERERAARGAQPRRFPPTSPNLAPCAVSIALGLSGPAFAVGASDAAGVEAALIAADLVAAGDASAAVVLSLEWPGAFVTELWRRRGRAPLVAQATACVLAAQGAGSLLDRGKLKAAWVRSVAAPPSADPLGLCGALRGASR